MWPEPVLAQAKDLEAVNGADPNCDKWHAPGGDAG